MTEEKARAVTVELFGEGSFTEFDDAGGIDRYYVGALPTESGPYTGFMGFSWEEALELARLSRLTDECARCWHTRGAHDCPGSDHGECTHYGCGCDSFAENSGRKKISVG